MSVTETTEVEHDEHDDHGDHDDHPSDRSYVMIAHVLAAFTAIEVLLFIFEDAIADSFLRVGSVKIALIALMIVKFWIVGSYFMHLKFDNPILTQLFVFGLLLAVVVYFIMLSAFEFNFWNDGLEDTGLPGGIS